MGWFRWFLISVFASLIVLPAVALAAGRGPDPEPLRAGDVISHVIYYYEHNGKTHPGKGPPGAGDPTPTPEPTPGDHSAHFSLLPGARSDSNVTYVLEDPGLPGAVAAINASFEAWDDVSGISFECDDPCGDADVSASIEAGAPNTRDTVSWALFLGNTKALAVTIIWISDLDGEGDWDAGEPIVETDMIFNNRHTWAVAEDDPRGKWFDIQNVGTHEVGHFVGLDDQDQWDDETMYFSASPRETKKRDLEPGDIAGAVALYGP